MSVDVNQQGKLIITVEHADDPAWELVERKKMLYDMLNAHIEAYSDPSPLNTGIEMLRDLELSYEQIKKSLK